ncbi:MAG: aldo/keto reductase, partial [Pseudomonadota bacterium]|nr:aldo/keto reductase [Pseudomonadota bacterium]
EKRGHSSAQIALAWMLSKPVITSPVIGVSKIEQLEQLIAATKITLSDDDIAYLEELYRPVANILDDEKPRSVMVKKD